MYKQGDLIDTEKFGEVLVISTNGWRDIVIQFARTGYTRKTNSSDLRKGLVKDLMQPTLFGVGYLGENWQEGKTKSTSYKLWNAMLFRVFGNPNKQTAYDTVSVCSDFLNFSIFERWVSECEYYKEGWELDKDLLSGNSKVYSSETCCFIPREVNLVITKKQRKDYLQGVRPSRNKFFASCRKGGDKVYLGTFDTEIEAFYAYKEAKESYIKVVANKWKDQIDPRVYEALMNYQVEITD